LGWLMTAPSIGAFSMALLQAHRGYRKAGRTLLLAVAGFSTAIVFGISETFGYQWQCFVSWALATTSVSSSARRSFKSLRLTKCGASRLYSLFIGTSNELLGAFESGLVLVSSGL
jgi:hypothetical protein